MKISDREKREWSLLIFIMPVGICLMMIAGQIAVRIVPSWSVNAGMQSSLDLENTSKKQAGFIQPLSPEILTPLGWFDTFLTPGSASGDNIVYPAFVVFEPSATPSPSPSLTSSPTATDTAVPTETPPPPTPTDTPASTPTKKTPKGDDSTPNPPTATATATPDPTTTPVAIDPLLTYDSVVVVETGTPDADWLELPSGVYVVVDVSGHPVIVENTPDGYYDLVFYEYNNGGSVAMDSIVIGISHLSDGSSYWQVFDWGDGVADTNTNISSIAGTEADNQNIPLNNLYPNPGTGILIDVDRATSTPPPGSYDYVVIISPLTGGDPAQVNSVDVTEVPIPTP